MPSASVPPSAADVLTAEAEHDPEVWLRILAWAVVVFSVAQVLCFSFGRDQGIYGLVAEGILEGQVPYRDRWDFKPPGIFFVYAGSMALLGKSMLAPRLVEAVMLIGAVLGLRRLGGVFFDSRTAGILGGAVYALVHAQMDFWHSGQPESFAGPLTVYAMVLTTHPWSRHRAHFAQVFTGLLFGMAFVLKPPFGGGAIACAYYLAAHKRSDGHTLLRSATPFLWIGVSSLVPILLCGLWFTFAGGFAALSWTLFEFAPGYTALSWVEQRAGDMFFHSLSEAFFSLSSLLAMGTIAAASIHPRARREREGLLFILGVLAFQFVGITIQGKFFQYHFGATIPLIASIAGLGYYKLWRRVALGSLSGTIAFLMFLAVSATMRLPVNDTPLGFWNRSAVRLQYLLSAGNALSRTELDEQLHYVGGYNLDIVRRTADEVRNYAAPGEYLYVWGFEPALYSLSEMKPSSRYVYNVPQRAKWQNSRPRATVMRDLHAHPPKVVVTQTRDAMSFVTGNEWNSTDSLPDFPAMHRFIESNYRKVRTIDRFSIWVPHEKARPE